MHPGSFTSGTEDGGLRLIAEALMEIFTLRPGGRTKILLEHTAGQGTNLGHRFEHLAAIIDGVGGSPRVGVCLDTCHLLTAGYDICSPEGYAETFRSFGRLVGFSRLKAFHMNDSKKPCGSRVDRHEHIGRGCLGLEPFRRILNDPRFARLPMLLETPKVDESDRRQRPELGYRTVSDRHVVRGAARSGRRRSVGRDESADPARVDAVSIAEDFRLESINERAALPGVGREAGLAAGMREKLQAIPAPFGRDLRQQQTASLALLDDEPVASDDDRAGIARIDLFERSEHRDLDLQVVELRRAHRLEPRIFAGGADRAARDLLGQWTTALERPDAAAQLSLALQRHERA